MFDKVGFVVGVKVVIFVFRGFLKSILKIEQQKKLEEIK